jgi:hypothetical protein
LAARSNTTGSNIYTDAYRQESLALAQRQLAALRAQFDPGRLSPAGRLSYRLFEEEVEQDIENFRWRWHSFPASTNGSPAGSLPVFLINQHRVAASPTPRPTSRACARSSG